MALLSWFVVKVSPALPWVPPCTHATPPRPHPPQPVQEGPLWGGESRTVRIWGTEPRGLWEVEPNTPSGPRTLLWMRTRLEGGSWQVKRAEIQSRRMEWALNPCPPECHWRRRGKGLCPGGQGAAEAGRGRKEPFPGVPLGFRLWPLSLGD